MISNNVVRSLTLRNLNLTGGSPSIYGGSIYSDGDYILTVSNCVFESNEALSVVDMKMVIMTTIRKYQ